MDVTTADTLVVAPPDLMRQKVSALQEQVLKAEQYEPPTRHFFHGGLYCREVFRQAGALIVGAVHKKEHMYLIASGTVMITDGEGEAQTYTGPHLFLSKPGTKRAVYALTDAVCMTFHAIPATTVEEAEAELVEREPESPFTTGNRLKANVTEMLP